MTMLNETEKRPFGVAILTVSDRVSGRLAEDRSGPALEALFSDSQTWRIRDRAVEPDDVDSIQRTVRLWSTRSVDLILTTGGTGFSPRDVTPEAVEPLLERKAPGFVHAMLSSSLKITPLAALSRPVCGTIGQSLIVTLPGSSKGAVENLSAILPLLAHALELNRGGQGAGEAFHKRFHGGNGGHVCRHDPVSQDAMEDTGPMPEGVAHRSRKSKYPLLSYEEALKTVMHHSLQLDTINAPLDSSLLGYVVAEDVFATDAIPNFRASIVDGYAVISTDGPGEYPVVAVSTAGSSPNAFSSLQPGQVTRIATGAPLPPGADSVVMVEATRLIKAKEGEEDTIAIDESVRFGQDVREIGSDIEKGDTVLRRGDIISAAEIGILSSMGIVNIKVYAKPKVAVLSSGNEIVDPQDDQSLRYGQVYDSNRASLLAALCENRYPSVDLGIALDERDKLCQVVQAGLRDADILVTTGGVSMGEKDLFKVILEQDLNATIHFGRVLLKPGKPTTFATVKLPGFPREKLIFALPGNPVSALVTFHLFVLPCLRKISGVTPFELPWINAKLATPVDLDPHRPEFQRVHLQISYKNSGETEFEAFGTGGQRSSRLMSMKLANAIVVLPSQKESDKTGLERGDKVKAILIGSL